MSCAVQGAALQDLACEKHVICGEFFEKQGFKKIG